MAALILADAAYLLALFFNLAALLLFTEWLLHNLPGSILNPVRRALFLASYPLLKFCDPLLTVKWGSFSFRGLLLAVLLLLLEHFGLPWLVLLSYSMRG